jgi:hypothetical protein
MDMNNETVAQVDQKIKVQPMNEDDNGFMKSLETNCHSVIEKIRHCDEQAEAWQSRKKELQEELKDMMDRIQKELGDTEEVPQARPKGKDSTTPELIRAYLEKHGPARTSDIRKFLLDHGKRTGPGVALARLVKEKSIENVDRGLYKIAN